MTARPPPEIAAPRDDAFTREILTRANIGVVLASLGGLGVRLAAGSPPDPGTIVGLVCLLMCAASAYLVRRTHLRAGTIIFLAMSWFLVAGISLARGPQYPATLPLYLLVTLLAGLLLSTRAAGVVAVLSSATATGIMYVHETGLLPAPEPIGVVYRTLAGVVAFMVVTITFVAALRRLRTALAELARKNAELERAREDLEATVEARTKSLVDAREAAEAASRAKSLFLANMSHELRTPMNAVLGMTDVLLASPLPEEDRKAVRTIREGGDALLSVLNDVLDLSAVEAGHLALERAPFEPRVVVADVVALMQPEARRAGITLCSDVPEGVPPQVVGDARRVRQVLMNLVGNAVKFTERGEIHLGVSVDGHHLRFAVRDSGLGIAPEDLRRIFEPFTQLDASPTRRRGGTGLGLAISRELAARMGGALSVASTVGTGSTFTLELPLLPAEAPNRPGVTPLPQVRPNLRILVAEDNEVNVRVLTRMLGHLGLRADVVGTGTAALAAIRTVTYDCVLMDVHMPEMDGLEATRRIRAEHNGEGPVVVAVTADALPEQRAAVRAAGVDEVLSKPILLDALAAALSRAAERCPQVSESKTGESA